MLTDHKSNNMPSQKSTPPKKTPLTLAFLDYRLEKLEQMLEMQIQQIHKRLDMLEHLAMQQPKQPETSSSAVTVSTPVCASQSQPSSDLLPLGLLRRRTLI